MGFYVANCDGKVLYYPSNKTIVADKSIDVCGVVPWFSLVSQTGDITVHPHSVLNIAGDTLSAVAPQGTVKITESKINFNEDVDYSETLVPMDHSKIRC